MIGGALYPAAALAGAAYVLAPGPAFLALLGIGASAGRRSATWFLAGHLVGDLTWAALALFGIIGATTFGPVPFAALGLLCGLYLGWLGLAAITARRGAEGEIAAARIARPLRRGLAFGLTNPKAYPVSFAMFSALLAGQTDGLGWTALPPLLAAALVGFLGADGILIAAVGTSGIRTLYRRYELGIIRFTGGLFLLFAAHAISVAWPVLVG